MRAALLAAIVLAVLPARADEMPSFDIVMKDGAITPARLAVPANAPFRLTIANQGATPAEFESVALHKEKVLAAGATSSLVIRRLEAGEYDFIDDFHPGARAVLVAK